MLAIVVDPIRSKISGRIDIGAFRTCNPEKNTQVDAGEQAEEAGTIPEDKIKDFGVHYKHYYKLDIEYFISERDSAHASNSHTFRGHSDHNGACTSHAPRRAGRSGAWARCCICC